MVREITQEPDGNRANEYHSSNFGEILLALLPSVSEHGLCRRNPVRRQLHHEREIVILDEMAESPCADDSERDAEDIKTEQDEAGMMREKCRRQKDIDRESAGAGHERNHENRQQAALARFDGASRHYCRHIAAEPHNHRDE